MTDRTVEEQLKSKLEAGEIDQEEYDAMIKKFEDLDLLGSKVSSKPKNYSFSGSNTIDGGDVSQPVRVSGKLKSLNSLTCPSLRVSGSLDVKGDLTVVESTRISGALRVDKKAKFGGNLRLSGKAYAGDDVFFTDIAKISGKFQTAGRLVTDSSINASGQLVASQIISKNLVKISGKISTSESLEAETLISSGGPSQIGTDLKANTIEIAKKWRTHQMGDPTWDDEEYEDPENMNSISELGSFISKMVTEFIPKVVNSVVGSSKMGSPPQIFVIENNIDGKSIDISYTHVKGDIIGDDIIIGPNVTVDGTIKYRKSLNVPEGVQYSTQTIE